MHTVFISEQHRDSLDPHLLVELNRRGKGKRRVKPVVVVLMPANYIPALKNIRSSNRCCSLGVRPDIMSEYCYSVFVKQERDPILTVDLVSKARAKDFVKSFPIIICGFIIENAAYRFLVFVIFNYSVYLTLDCALVVRIPRDIHFTDLFAGRKLNHVALSRVFIRQF